MTVMTGTAWRVALAAALRCEWRLLRADIGYWLVVALWLASLGYAMYGGVQTAAQVADTIAWLLSDGAARITGQDNATAMAIGTSFWIVSAEKLGCENGGRPMRKAPMLPIPVRALPNQWLSSAASRLPASSAAIMCGNFGHQRRTSRLQIKVTRATIVM